MEIRYTIKKRGVKKGVWCDVNWYSLQFSRTTTTKTNPIRVPTRIPPPFPTTASRQPSQDRSRPRPRPSLRIPIPYLSQVPIQKPHLAHCQPVEQIVHTDVGWWWFQHTPVNGQLKQAYYRIRAGGGHGEGVVGSEGVQPKPVLWDALNVHCVLHK